MTSYLLIFLMPSPRLELWTLASYSNNLQITYDIPNVISTLTVQNSICLKRNRYWHQASTINQMNIQYFLILKDRGVTCVSEIKFLEAWLDQNLNWDCHLENVIVKLSKLCFTIKSFVSKSIVKNHVFCIFTFVFKIQYFILGKHQTSKKILNYKEQQ